MDLISYIATSKTTPNALAVRAGICPHIIHRKVKEQARGAVPKAVTTAQRIETATGGAITAAEWLGLAPCRCAKITEAIDRIHNTDGGTA